MYDKIICVENNRKLGFWVKAKQYDMVFQIYRELKRKNCQIDKNLENFVFLKFFKENLDANDKKTLNALTQLIQNMA